MHPYSVTRAVAYNEAITPHSLLAPQASQAPNSITTKVSGVGAAVFQEHNATFTGIEGLIELANVSPEPQSNLLLTKKRKRTDESSEENEASENPIALRNKVTGKKVISRPPLQKNLKEYLAAKPYLEIYNPDLHNKNNQVHNKRSRKKKKITDPQITKSQRKDSYDNIAGLASSSSAAAAAALSSTTLIPQPMPAIIPPSMPVHRGSVPMISTTTFLLEIAKRINLLEKNRTLPQVLNHYLEYRQWIFDVVPSNCDKTELFQWAQVYFEKLHRSITSGMRL
jgi:hypothetical protein